MKLPSHFLFERKKVDPDENPRKSKFLIEIFMAYRYLEKYFFCKRILSFYGSATNIQASKSLRENFRTLRKKGFLGK